MEPLSQQNPWILSVGGAQRRMPAWLLLLSAVMALGIALFVSPLVFAFWDGLYQPASPAFVLSRTVYYVLLLLPMYGVAGVSLIWERRAPILAGLTGWKGLLLGGAVGGLLFMLALVAASLAGVLQRHPLAVSDGRVSGMALMAILTAFQAYGEEFFFRAWLQPSLSAQLGLVPGLAITAALFCGAHFIIQSASIIPAVNMLLAGFMFGLMAFRTAGLLAPFAAHAVWNWLEQSVAGLVPNPGIDPLGSAFDLDLVGPLPLSGGSDGLNGSLFLTAVLLIATAGFLLAGEKDLKRQGSGLQSLPGQSQQTRVF